MTAVSVRAVRLDADVKVSRRGVYTSDVELPRMLHACFVRSPYAHAEVLSVVASASLNMPGVCAVLSADNVLDYFPNIQPHDVTCNLRGEGPAGRGFAVWTARALRGRPGGTGGGGNTGDCSGSRARCAGSLSGTACCADSRSGIASGCATAA